MVARVSCDFALGTQDRLSSLPATERTQVRDLTTGVADDCTCTTVSTMERTLPDCLKLRRRAPKLYRRVIQRHPRSCYTIVVNEVNTAGPHMVTSPTNRVSSIILASSPLTWLLSGIQSTLPRKNRA
ncbi:hypothetical protein EDD16DRAFT_1565049 [Pisolithus croceorrhizus]|nr:hypothetical protein EDD16DRAFT_1565049 [Pisolithus croceorrhizus]